MSAEPTFFAYLHARPETVDAHGVFYVGKGQGSRHRDFVHRTAHHKNIVAKHGVDNLLIGKYDCSSEAVAMDLEKGLIKRLRAMGVKLANYTDGGDGLSGHRHSEATKAQMSRSGKLRPPPSEETRAKTSVRVKALWEQGVFKGVPHTPETKAKLSAARLGKPNLFLLGKPKSEETKAKISATKLAKPIVKCIHCDTTGREGGAMKRYHFDNCKFSDPTYRAPKKETKTRSQNAAQREASRKRWQENNPSSRPDVKVLRSESSKKNWANPVLRERMTKALSASWSDERKLEFSQNNPSHRADVNAKKSAALKGTKRPTLTCPHCTLEGGDVAMLRYHFDNCKKRDL